MDDADLGDDIDRYVGEVEDENENENEIPHQKRFENDRAHLDPSRWWFASSAFPMIAGTLGPVASAFSICALVRPWRQHIALDVPIDVALENAEFIKDPAWLLIVNGIQLVVALVSNVFLSLNMARRVRFSIAQPITIVGWYISSICLTTLNATAAGPLVEEPKVEYVWSQAFWYGMWAAILYFVVASLMVVTVYGAHTGHYPREFQLTNSQRTLMLQTILVLIYMLVGALVFSTIEGWQYLDAVYWADVTLFTVGFGDFAAATTLGRALLFPYALIGVISLGLVIGSIRSLVLERGRRRLDVRMVEKRRRGLVKTMTRRGNIKVLKPIRDEEPGTTPADENLKTEFERRGEEFALMRKIQTEAQRERRWVAMAVSTGSWLVLWLVGSKVFMEFEKPYQGWTYFEGFYFAFVTLTTIGYGDRTPISPGGKSFFVFWSLLALPTMTVLISNAGETVVKGVRDATLQLGNITILPGEKGFKAEIQHISHRLSFGLLFKHHFVSTPPGFFATSQPVEAEDEEAEDEEAEESSDQGDGDASTQDDQQRQSRPPNRGESFERTVARSLSIIRDPNKPLPDIPSELNYILICEIAKVTQDMKHAKPRRYSFAEWAWYLKLIGEDEGSAETHRTARPHVHSNSKKAVRKPYRRTFTEKLEDEGEKWSWVGEQSPLIGSQEESEWILERLTQRLREQLAAARRAEKGQMESGVGENAPANEEASKRSNEVADQEAKRDCGRDQIGQDAA